MEKFRREFHCILSNTDVQHDLANFWLRKTKKPVLSVLLVEKKGVIKLYRGTNMEVSMPTGSLCAERNVIGSALADDPTLMRQDIKVIAVYSGNMSASSSAPPLQLEETRSQRADSMQESLGAMESIIDQNVGSPTTRCLPCGGNSPPGDSSLMIVTSEEYPNNSSTLPSVSKSPITGQKRKIFRMTSKTIPDEEIEYGPEYQDLPQLPEPPFGSPSKVGTMLRSAKKKAIDNGPSQIMAVPESVSNSKSKKGRKKSIPFSSPVPNSATTNSIVPTMTTIYVEENDMNPLKVITFQSLILLCLKLTSFSYCSHVVHVMSG